MGKDDRATLFFEFADRSFDVGRDRLLCQVGVSFGHEFENSFGRCGRIGERGL
jgi:hypothetical protein